jgi:hypothetical protein
MRGWILREGGTALSLFSAQWTRWYLAALCLCTLVGCSGGSATKLVPVVGKVSVDGQPLTTGSVAFRPEKGSPSSEIGGEIDEEGSYRLFTAGKEGAPPGRYRVLVVAVDPNDLKKKFPYGKRTSYVNPKYSNPKTTDVIVEVTPSPAPGAYDLKLAK